MQFSLVLAYNNITFRNIVKILFKCYQNCLGRIIVIWASPCMQFLRNRYVDVQTYENKEFNDMLDTQVSARQLARYANN